MSILFFRTADRYGCFSNFSRHPTHVYGSLWPTAEHAFQAMKFFPHRSDLVKKVLAAATPREAANLGRDRQHPLHPGWERSPENVVSFRIPDADDTCLRPDDGLQHEEPLFNRLKDLIMYEVTYAKAMQHADVRAALLETQSEPIIEDSTSDVYWGWGTTHAGENKLGRIWIAVRSALRRGMETGTAFGKPDRVDFVCTAGYPWKTQYGPAAHPDATGTGQLGTPYAGFRCPHCEHYYEMPISS